MSQTTTNFKLPYPESSDTRDQVIQSTAQAIIAIDQILASLQATIGTGPGQGLIVVGGQLTVNPGFALKFDAFNRIAVDDAVLAVDPLITQFGNTFRLFLDSVNIAVNNSGANSDISFSPSYHPKPIDLRIADDNVGTTLTVGLFEVSSVDDLNKIHKFILFSETSHNNSSFQHLPFETAIAAENVIDFKLIYTNPTVNKFVLGVLYNTGTVNFFTIQANNITTVATLATTIVTQTYANSWDICMDPNSVNMGIAYLSAPRIPIGFALDLVVFTTSTPVILHTTPTLTNDATCISIACDNTVGMFIAFYIESGAPKVLHSGSFLATSGLLIVEATLIQTLYDVVKAQTQTTGVVCASISLATGNTTVFYKDNTNTPVIVTSAIFTGHQTDILWGFTRNGVTNTYTVIYRSLDAITTTSMTYSSYTYAVGPTQNIITSNDIFSSDVSFDRFFAEIPGQVSNFIFSTISTPNVGLVFYYADLNFYRGKYPLKRNLITIGGAQAEDELLMRFPMALDVLFVRNTKTSIRVDFPLGSALYDIILADQQLAYIELTGAEEVNITKTTFTRDITIINDAITGIKIDSLSTYVHNQNRFVLFFRDDSYSRAITGSNDKRVYFGNGISVTTNHIYEPDPEQFHGPGLKGSGASQHVDAGEFVTFDKEGKLTLVLANPGVETASAVLFDRSADAFVDIGSAGLGDDLQSVFREAVLGSLITAPAAPVPIVFKFRLPGLPTNVVATNFVLYESATPTITTPPNPDNKDADLNVNAGTAIPVPIAFTEVFLGDTILVSEPITWTPSAGKAYIMQYQLSRANTGISYFVYVQSAPGPDYRALAGGTILPPDVNWGSPTNVLYQLYPNPPLSGAPPHNATPPFVNFSLGIIHQILTLAQVASKHQGVVISDQNGAIGAHNSLAGLQGGNTVERYHMTQASWQALTNEDTTIDNADLQHSHNHNSTTNIQGGDGVVIAPFPPPGKYHLTLQSFQALSSQDGNVDDADLEHYHTHQLLQNLQGGSIVERYHMTQASWIALTNEDASVDDASLQHHHDSLYYKQSASTSFSVVASAGGGIAVGSGGDGPAIGPVLTSGISSGNKYLFVIYIHTENSDLCISYVNFNGVRIFEDDNAAAGLGAARANSRTRSIPYIYTAASSNPSIPISFGVYKVNGLVGDAWNVDVSVSVF